VLSAPLENVGDLPRDMEISGSIRSLRNASQCHTYTS